MDRRFVKRKFVVVGRTGPRGLAKVRTGAGILPGAHSARQGMGCFVFSTGGAPQRPPVHEGLATLPRCAGDDENFHRCLTPYCLALCLMVFRNCFLGHALSSKRTLHLKGSTTWMCYKGEILLVRVVFSISKPCGEQLLDLLPLVPDPISHLHDNRTVCEAYIHK